MSGLTSASKDLEAVKNNQTRGEQPARKPNSLRRTVSWQSSWPGGAAAPGLMQGRARDLFTLRDAAAPEIRGADWITATLDKDRRIINLDGSLHRDALNSFAGLTTGGQLRKAAAAALPGAALDGTRVYRLLDDMAGANFLSSAAWYAWPGSLPEYHALSGTPVVAEQAVSEVCLSFAAGSDALNPDGTRNDDFADHPAGPLPLTEADAHAFHELYPLQGPNQWRLRRTDVWLADGALQVDSWFQDSSVIHGLNDRRLIMHEYSINGQFDPKTLKLLFVDVTPHVLPYTTCRAAPATAKTLQGRSALDFNADVPNLLRGTAGCTHLNDMLRSLQDVSGLSRLLSDA